MSRLIAEVKFSEIAGLIRKAYPNAKSRRTVKICERQTYSVRDYWDGGSREYAVFLDLKTGNTITPASVPALTENNIYRLPSGNVELSPGIVVIVNSIFCGKDLGYRIYVCGDVKVNDGVLEMVSAPVMPALPEKTTEE
jgi:hypothetical protein